jgi:ribosomal protein S12 methylthiotransferase accessory factor
MRSLAQISAPDAPAIARIARAPWPDAAPFCAFLAELRAPPGSEDSPARVATGAGATEAEARGRTLAEAAERYSLIFRGDEPARVASVRALGAEAVALDDLLLLSARQVRGAGLWNLRQRGRHTVPPPVDRDLSIAWLRPVERLSSAPLLVPESLILLGHPDRKRAPALAGRSTGAAAGRSLADAALRGAYELIERDAAAIWWHNRLARPELATPRTGWIGAVARWLASEDRTLHFLDLTDDLGVPVAAAVSLRDRRAPLIASAAAATPREAAESALRELLLTMINLHFLARTVARDGWSAIDADAAYMLAWHQSVHADELGFLLPAGKRARIRANAQRGSAATRWRALRESLERRGLSVLVFDATQSEIGVPVAKVVVPGLRPTLARFAPGRLYDVPVRLGWLARRRSEAQLHPDPYPF